MQEQMKASGGMPPMGPPGGMPPMGPGGMF